MNQNPVNHTNMIISPKPGSVFRRSLDGYTTKNTNTFQISRHRHIPLTRFGIFNETVSDVVLSSEFTKVRLSPETKESLQNLYEQQQGQPMVVRFYTPNPQATSCDCCACLTAVCCCWCACCWSGATKLTPSNINLPYIMPQSDGFCLCFQPPTNPIYSGSHLRQSATEVWFGNKNREYDVDYWSDWKAYCRCYTKVKSIQEQYAAIDEHAMVIYVPTTKASLEMWTFDINAGTIIPSAPPQIATTLAVLEMNTI